jgi:hypothetical protein
VHPGWEATVDAHGSLLVKTSGNESLTSAR